MNGFVLRNNEYWLINAIQCDLKWKMKKIYQL